MHHGRFGGNARKRKAKLTDATFHAVIRSAPVPDAPVAVIDLPAAPAADPLREEEFTTAEVVLEYPARPARTVVQRVFLCQDYQFGYVACPNCHNDQAYYVHRESLALGYIFRCRICRMEITLSE